ncbi:MAG: peptidoglycan/xylan/chitin deacetylase (PgdA/CDA1 family) [Parvibaculaceae bacterium]|jgi:peptidoglycan/xylan/chitin deacetylase (PgdA/CDA1 family)
MNQTALLKKVMAMMHMTRLHHLAPESVQGVGVIFMLHRVRKEPVPEFSPNRILEITPEFLTDVIDLAKSLDYDIVTLDEAIHRLQHRKFKRRFASFTLDDGYEDNVTQALPVFERNDVPFTAYLNSGMPDGTAELWWLGLEQTIQRAEHLTCTLEGIQYDLPCTTAQEKDAAFSTLYWPVRRLPETEIRDFVRELAARHDIELLSITREASMSWDQARVLHAHPLATVGSHTVDHFAMRNLDELTARREVLQCNRRIQEELGFMPEHFAYPYGDASSAGKRDFKIIQDLGFKSAVTTRKGLLMPKHGKAYTSLPRLSLNGDYQDLRFIEVLLSGLPFAMAQAIPKFGTG